jgi:hypothetical protein
MASDALQEHATPNCTADNWQTQSSASLETVAIFTATHRAVTPGEGKTGNNQRESRMGFFFLERYDLLVRVAEAPLRVISEAVEWKYAVDQVRVSVCSVSIVFCSNFVGCVLVFVFWQEHIAVSQLTQFMSDVRKLLRQVRYCCFAERTEESWIIPIAALTEGFPCHFSQL